MRDKDRTTLLGERNQLRRMIEALPESATIERISLESRLKKIQSAIEASATRSSGETATVTFQGAPVQGSKGIAADFASKAIGSISEFFGAVAAGVEQDVQAYGPIPSIGQHRPYIVGTVRGSFGFRFEFPANEGLFQEIANEPVRTAVDRAFHFLRVAESGSDDDLAEIMETVQPRAVKKAFDFISTVQTGGATVELRSKRNRITLHDPHRLQTIVERLRADNIHEETTELVAQLVGVLPNDRSFEARDPAAPQKPVKGKVGHLISPDWLNRQWLYKTARLTIQTTQVGTGRPRSILTKIEGLSDDTDSPGDVAAGA